MTIRLDVLNGTDWENGRVSTAADFNDTIDEINDAIDNITTWLSVPVGSIIPWVEFSGVTNDLPSGWEICDGSTVTVDASSPYGDGNNEYTLPNLEGLYLRGSTTSGTNATPTHTHTVNSGSSTNQGNDSGNNQVSPGVTGSAEIAPPAITVHFIMRLW